MKFQIPKAAGLSVKLASRTFEINMLAEILRLCSLKMTKSYNEEITKEYNQYFRHITDFLNLYEFSDVRICEGLDDIDNMFINLEIIQVS